jgi:hypothetical protein
MCLYACAGATEHGRASERRHRPDGHLPRGHHDDRFHPRRPLRHPPRPLKRGARDVKKSNPCMRARLATAVCAAHRRRAAAASALPQPSPHLMHCLTSLVCATSAVIHAADTSPTRRRQGRHRAPRAGCGSPSQRSRAAAVAPRRPWRAAACTGGRVPCAERLGPRWTAAAWSLGRVAAPSFWCLFRVPVANAKLRPLMRRSGSEAAPSGPGLAWGWWLVAPGPVGAASHGRW